ncbi:MAG: galactose-1-phosphate uridylyltransferase [Gaiellales bacterium]
MVIAPGRATRPGALSTTRLADARTCPFCAGHEGMTPPEVLALGRDRDEPDTPGWTVRVVPNKYPAIPGQEVVVHGPAHATSLTDVPPAVITTAMQAWELRREHHRAAGAAHLLAAINQGAAAGASLEHSHSQLVPFAQLPPLAATHLRAFEHGCRLCDALAGESARTVRMADGLRTFCPSWSRVPYEVWLTPESHGPEPDDPRALAGALLDAAGRLERTLGSGAAWNAILHAAPLQDRPSYHWHVEILPRLTVQASVELGAGVWINVVDPDAATDELR